jgi:D-alanyl-D-alanine carboxypeptidase
VGFFAKTLPPLGLSLALFAAPALADGDLPQEPSHEVPRQELSPQKQSLSEALTKIWAGHTLRRGTTAVYVVDANTGEELYRVHEDEALNPASNVKLISTATVLANLGPDWRYETKLIARPQNYRGVLQGNVYLSGNYDPTLHPRSLDTLARQLAEQGVQMIDGDVVLSDDLHRDTLATGQIKVTVEAVEGADSPTVTVWPQTAFAIVDQNTATVQPSGRSRVRVASRLIEGEDGPSLHLEVTGRIREGHRRIFWKPVQRRSSFTGHALAAALERAGIQVHGRVRIATIEDIAAESRELPALASAFSQPISKLVRRVNKRSINHLADRLVMTAAGEAVGKAPSMEGAVELMHAWLRSIGISEDKVVVDTGSGLSYRRWPCEQFPDRSTFG